ncbi:MAG: septum formation initiator family protein [Planktomarina sp.]
MNRLSNLGPLAITAVSLTLAAYFCVSAVQGELGILKRTDLEAEEAQLRTELASLDAQVARMENKTRRLSDDYLDLDLLGTQIKDVLGYVRPDDILLQ